LRKSRVDADHVCRILATDRLTD